MGTAPQPQRKVSDVLQDIVGNIQQAIRLEVVLAKAEVKEKAEEASRPAVILSTGTILGLYGFGILTSGGGLWTVAGGSTMARGTDCGRSAP